MTFKEWWGKYKNDTFTIDSQIIEDDMEEAFNAGRKAFAEETEHIVRLEEHYGLDEDGEEDCDCCCCTVLREARKAILKRAEEIK